MAGGGIKAALKGKPETGGLAGGIHFQVSGLGSQVPGTGPQVRVLVPGLIPEPVPVPVPAAETCDPEMFLTFAPLHRP